jgi:hypothetical protein
VKTNLIIYALAATLTVINGTEAQTREGNGVPVTADNFIRAESDLYFDKLVKDGSFGKFIHNRELTPIDKQLVVRSNRDTLNSSAVFDLDAGPVKITLPNAGKRFMSMQGFWSISVYNDEGYYESNDLNAYSLNNITAKKSEDGSVTIQFGGCDGTIPNCLPILKGWNYVVRLYRPRAEILNGKWKFPAAQPVN